MYIGAAVSLIHTRVIDCTAFNVLKKSCVCVSCRLWSCVCVCVLDCGLQHNADDTQWRWPRGADYWTEDVGSVWQSARHCRHITEDHCQQQPDEHFCLCWWHQTTPWQQVGIVMFIAAAAAAIQLLSFKHSNGINWRAGINVKLL